MKKLVLSLAFLPLAFNNLAQTSIITTIAGNGAPGFSGDGNAATSCQMNVPGGMCFDALGNMYIADAQNHRIRKISTTGIITTVAGTGAAGFSGDGGLATSAQLNRPIDIVMDAPGNLYIADEFNFVIRKISTSGFISTCAGTGVSGYTGDGGLATSAKLTRPNTVSIDSAGNLYISLYQNNVVRKVNTSGIISTIAGNGTVGFSGDGGLATSAKLNEPCKVAVDKYGNFFIADEYNQRIRKVNTSGIITTVAGTGTAGYSGDGGLATSAQINYVEQVIVDGLGNLYISEKLSNVIRKISTSGIISTIIGTGVQGYSGDGGPASAATLHTPQFMKFDVNGNLYVSDAGNNVIRKITNVTIGINEVHSAFDLVNVFPNPSNGKVAIEFAGTEAATYTITNLLGDQVKSGKLSLTENSIEMESLANGVYNLIVTQKEKASIIKLVLQK